LTPALILLDLMMPVMDGRQFRHHLMQDKSIPAIPVVIMSANARDPRLDCLSWLQKPIGLDRLLCVIREVDAAQAPT
jgi:CheY-like chemotaxis protein